MIPDDPKGKLGPNLKTMLSLKAKGCSSLSTPHNRFKSLSKQQLKSSTILKKLKNKKNGKRLKPLKYISRNPK